MKEPPDTSWITMDVADDDEAFWRSDRAFTYVTVFILGALFGLLLGWLLAVMIL